MPAVTVRCLLRILWFTNELMFCPPLARTKNSSAVKPRMTWPTCAPGGLTQSTAHSTRTYLIVNDAEDATAPKTRHSRELHSGVKIRGQELLVERAPAAHHKLEVVASPDSVQIARALRAIVGNFRDVERGDRQSAFSATQRKLDLADDVVHRAVTNGNLPPLHELTLRRAVVRALEQTFPLAMTAVASNS
jgi:hypothetical protein